MNLFSKLHKTHNPRGIHEHTSHKGCLFPAGANALSHTSACYCGCFPGLMAVCQHVYSGFHTTTPFAVVPLSGIVDTLLFFHLVQFSFTQQKSQTQQNISAKDIEELSACSLVKVRQTHFIVQTHLL